MNAIPRRRTLAVAVALMVAACPPLGGCLAYTVVTAPVKLAVGAVEVAGDVAIGTVKVAGSVASGAIKLAAGLAKSGAVTFVDGAKNNQVARVSWRQGMTLASAAEAAKVMLVQRPVEIVREGKVVYAAANGPDKNVSVAAGDVVQIEK